jgi:hypothetical protein
LGVLMSPLLTALRLVNLRAGSENLLRPRLKFKPRRNLGTRTSRSLRIRSVWFSPAATRNLPMKFSCFDGGTLRSGSRSRASHPQQREAKIYGTATRSV